MMDSKVRQYLSKLSPDHKEIARKLDSTVHKVDSGVRRNIKAGKVIYSSRDGEFCGIKAQKNGVHFIFKNGVAIQDIWLIMRGNATRARSINFTSAEEIDEELLAGYIKQAIELENMRNNS